MVNLKFTLKLLLALFFLVAGANHFVMTPFYLRMMPPPLPFPRELVWISGIAEMALALLLLIPRTSILSAWSLIALLVAVFPANLQMAFHPDTFPEFPPAALWLRLPLQAVLIAWTFWYTRPLSNRHSAIPFGMSAPL